MLKPASRRKWFRKEEKGEKKRIAFSVFFFSILLTRFMHYTLHGTMLGRNQLKQNNNNNNNKNKNKINNNKRINNKQEKTT